MANLPARRYVLPAIASILVVYIVTRLGLAQPARYWPGSGKQQVNSVDDHTPLLGHLENPAALWYPALDHNSNLRIPHYNGKASGASGPRTPLFIGFTRSETLLEQTVLSYIAAGWPRSDIIIVDNSGTFDTNPQGLLSPHNTFGINFTRYRQEYGVSILQTPTLLNFAQLMNFYLRIAIAQHWSFFFWTHQDVAVLGDESGAAGSYRSFHQRILDMLAELGFRSKQDLTVISEAKSGDWAVKFFAYDWLTLVNVAAWRTIGQWNTFIPYYTADCDAYSRVALHGFTKEDAKAGHIYDMAESVPDPASRFFAADPAESSNFDRYKQLKHDLQTLMDKKWRVQDSLRNSWQDLSHGGRGELWTYETGWLSKDAVGDCKSREVDVSQEMGYR